MTYLYRPDQSGEGTLPGLGLLTKYFRVSVLLHAHDLRADVIVVSDGWRPTDIPAAIGCFVVGDGRLGDPGHSFRRKCVFLDIVLLRLLLRHYVFDLRHAGRGTQCHVVNLNLFLCLGI